MRVLFIIPSFSNGGTVSSLKNLLPELSRRDYNSSVYAISFSGPNIDYFRQYCTIIGDNQPQIVKVSIWHRLSSLIRWIKRLLSRISIDISPIAFRIVAKRINGDYDYIIAFQEGQATLLASYFTNVKKIAWIHCDYKNYLRLSKRRPEYDVYNKFDKIICVSNYTKQQFIECMGNLKSRVISINNILDARRIKALAHTIERNDLPYSKECFNIVSIGRLDPVKRFSQIPSIIMQVKEYGVSAFKWFLIGDGVEKELITELKIKSLVDEFIIMGEINNPYPYLSSADLFVSLSYSEACPYVINEAKILHVPIVATTFGSINEFLVDGDGCVITDIESIASVIARIITDKDYYQKLKESICGFEYDNSTIINTIVSTVLTKDSYYN